MPRYLISLAEGAMTFPDEDLPAMADAAQAVVREAKAAVVWVFGCGLLDHGEATTVATDGSVSNGPYPGPTSFVGGPSIVDVLGRGVQATDVGEHHGTRSFAFSDPEGRWFAVTA